MPDRDIDRERARELLEALDESSPATLAELATALDAHPVTVERCCRALQRDGHIRLCTGGTYALVDSDSTRGRATPADPGADSTHSPSPAD